MSVRLFHRHFFWFLSSDSNKHMKYNWSKNLEYKKFSTYHFIILKFFLSTKEITKPPIAPPTWQRCEILSFSVTKQFKNS